MVRKVMIVIMVITYLFGVGIAPLMNVWNIDISVGGVPFFFIGLWIIAALLVLETLFLFFYEKNDDDVN